MGRSKVEMGDSDDVDFSKITEYFSTEMGGVDLTQLLANGVLAEICDAFDEYSMLVFHDQAFGDDTQIAFSMNLGPLEKMRKTKPGGGKHIPNIVLATNEMYPADHWRLLYNKGNEMWHTDSSFKLAPSPAEQARLDGLVVVHSFEYTRNLIDKGTLTDAMRAEHSFIKHALVRAGPTVSEDGMSLSAA
jgi:alpha-ketoglutarate-dependent 2,4-dichlorophenoxyacetate dioxygenase